MLCISELLDAACSTECREMIACTVRSFSYKLLKDSM